MPRRNSMSTSSCSCNMWGTCTKSSKFVEICTVLCNTHKTNRITVCFDVSYTHQWLVQTTSRDLKTPCSTCWRRQCFVWRHFCAGGPLICLNFRPDSFPCCYYSSTLPNFLMFPQSQVATPSKLSSSTQNYRFRGLTEFLRKTYEIITSKFRILMLFQNNWIKGHWMKLRHCLPISAEMQVVVKLFEKKKIIFGWHLVLLIIDAVL